MNFIYTWCLDRVDPEKREEWEMQLDLPLPGEEDREPSEAVLEMEGQNFMAAMMQAGG